MDKTINALGLMSGTSMDGIDASIMISDGERHIDIKGNLYLKYDSELKNALHDFCKKINSLQDIKNNQIEYNRLERKITIKHSEIASKICKKFSFNPNIIGFHGQTILHKPDKKYSIQMGNPNLMSQLLKKNIICQFRKNDIENGGEGAPLTPIYHHYLKKKLNIRKPIIFLNIGGIANLTFSKSDIFLASDVGPGNCLMDNYLKKTKKIDYDNNGDIASSGKIDNSLINSILDHQFYNSQKKHSYDINDFDINFVKGLSIHDAMANLNYFTAKTISENIKNFVKDEYSIILCGGGRKNLKLVSNIKSLLNHEIKNIDEYGIDGDFIESQAFAYLAIRSLLKKNITFPSTTNVKKAITGGELIKFI